ncbi:MAG: CpaF family protein [Anaerolineae bacterium]|nr:CpaF family protein [Anaerolineae bacterium]
MMNSKNQLTPLAALEPLLADPDAVEIMINGYQRVFIDKHGKLQNVPTPFKNEADLKAVIDTILKPMGLVANACNPIVDTRLSDNSRVNVVMPPIAVDGPALTIRKFWGTRQLTLDDVVRFGAISEDILTFLRACVESHLNILISGGTGSGKTTLLRLIAEMIPTDRRIIVVQNATEMRLPQPNTLHLESRPVNAEGQGEVTIQELIINALRMRPDHIVLGEARSSEILELIQAMNTGHEGCLLALHATSPRDALDRMEVMITYHPISLPVLTVRSMIAKTINIIVQIERLYDGSRKVSKITEVLGMEGNTITMQDIFEFQESGREEGKISGRFRATGKIPRCMERMQAYDVELPLSLFTPR